MTWDPRKGDANTYRTTGNISNADEAPVQVLGDSGGGGEFLPSPHGVASVPDCCIVVDFGGRDPRSNEICEVGNTHVLSSAPRRHLKLDVGVVAKSPIITYPWLRVSGPSSVPTAFLPPLPLLLFLSETETSGPPRIYSFQSIYGKWQVTERIWLCWLGLMTKRRAEFI